MADSTWATSNFLAYDVEEVDVIVAGGGTAGCVVAGRLAAADPSLAILVIEYGKDSLNDPAIRYPGVALHHLNPALKTARFYEESKESPALAGRKAVVPTGSVLGGGSAINFMMYTRAQACDFDSWNTIGWTANDMVPFLQKLETYHGPGNTNTHGFHGPVHISNGPHRSINSENDFIAAAAEVGFPEIRDLQDLRSCNGVSRWLRYVSPDGERQDTAYTYLHQLLKDKPKGSLHVLIQHKVTRVLFDESQRAYAVEFTQTPVHHPVPLTQNKHKIKPSIPPPVQRVVRARKLVVISCGACSTPLVLERSGIGSREVLQEAGVQLVAEVPGVGYDYQDHNGVFPAYKTCLLPHETNNTLINGSMSLGQALALPDPRASWNTVDVAAKIRPTESEVAALGPEFQTLWAEDFENEPSKPLMLLAFIPAYTGPDHSLLSPAQFVSVASYSAYPYSRGSIHICASHEGSDDSSNDDSNEDKDPIKFSTGYFSDEKDFDLKAHIWSYKKQREIMRRTEMFRGELEISHPRFAPGSKAACIPDFNPPAGAIFQRNDVPRIEYSAEDDKAIEEYLRKNINTTWHSLGTAKMAPLEEMGVVDRNLNVYGVSRLKVVDLSIAPKNVGANTNNTAIAIGEKGADIIARELGLRNWS